MIRNSKSGALHWASLAGSRTPRTYLVVLCLPPTTTHTQRALKHTHTHSLSLSRASLPTAHTLLGPAARVSIGNKRRFVDIAFKPPTTNSAHPLCNTQLSRRPHPFTRLHVHASVPTYTITHRSHGASPNNLNVLK